MSAGTVTRREKQARTRRALLDAAAQLFGEHGLEGASVERIATAAGYTKGAFYANFASKEELFLVMLEEQFARELERLERELAGQGDPRAEALAAAADFIHFAGDGEWPRLYFQFAAHAARDEAFRKELCLRQQAMRERLSVIFARWADKLAAEPPLPIPEITAMVYFTADGFLFDRMIEPELPAELYGTMVSVFLLGLQALAAERDAGRPSTP